MSDKFIDPRSGSEHGTGERLFRSESARDLFTTLYKRRGLYWTVLIVFAAAFYFFAMRLLEEYQGTAGGKPALWIAPLQAALEAGVKVIGVSGDSVEAQKKFQTKYNLPFPLLADTKAEVMKAFGVPVRAGKFAGSPVRNECNMAI